jgi:alpha-maltose-1-phosphate synthase
MPKGNNHFTGIIGSRLIGVDPYDRRAWSGISPYFFNEANAQGLLHRAFGADVTKADQLLRMALNFHPKKQSWRQNYYLDPSYREALTQAVAAKIEPTDLEGGLLQFGAMFDTPSILKGKTWCTSYHDGNLALRLRSPFGSAGISPRRIRQALAYEQSVYDGLSHIFTMSEYLRQSFIDDFAVSPEKVTCIGAGVNLEHIPERPDQKSYTEKKILFVGIEFERKGGNVLLQSFKNVRERHRDATLHIVGPSDLKVPSALGTNVTCHGFLDKQDQADQRIFSDLLQTSTLFVLPSLYEPFGIAPAEAMLHGIPAIVSGDWALGETVEDGVTGWHVEPGSVDSLTAALDDALYNESARSERGQNACTHARENFLWSKVISRLGERLSQTVIQANT